MKIVANKEIEDNDAEMSGTAPDGQEQSEAEDLCPSTHIIPKESSLTPAPARLMNTTWCKCATCVSLPTEMESVCCQEIEKLKSHLQGRSCITEHPIFQLYCQREDVVNINLRLVRRFPPPASELNKCLRRVCYRAFSAWIHGYRGEEGPKPIPACVVHKVRSRFPSLQNVFTNFRFSCDPPAEDMAWE
ncbi:hypothetical protein GDO81_019200 [Engystomops pustulosus]|uniref:P2X purinoreceptor 7 intracellular domain-containing protein n=1 Tax=Engystomops pustulosus TaxID=76066 RepID=A0AAV6Z9Y0_ENGPU|nr:hypothetical protein GDO81_019200 [Engystomops pustulosus]